MHSSMDGDVDISRHTARGILPNRYILIPGTGSTSTSTTTGAASMLESRVMFSVILAATALLSFWCPNEIPLGAATYSTVNGTISATKRLNRYDFVISLFQHIKCVLIDVFFRFPKRSRSRKHHDSDSNPTFFVFILFSFILPPTSFFLIYFVFLLSFFGSLFPIIFSHVIVRNHAMQIHPIRKFGHAYQIHSLVSC